MMGTASAGSATATGLAWPGSSLDPATVVPVEPAWPSAERAEPHAGVRDEGAFATVFDQEHGRAMRLAYLLTGDRDTAEDAVAEAFVRTFEKWRAGKVERVGPYLRQAVVNQVRNHRRSMARLRQHEDRKRGDDRGVPPPAEQVAVREVVDVLLERLPYRQHAAIVLRYYEDLSEAETAAALGCRRGTVKSLIARGMEALRDHAVAAGLERADANGAA